MTPCLDDIQIEEALGDPADERITAHLSCCDACRRRLEGARSIRLQLRAAFAQAHVSPATVDRVRRMTLGHDGRRPPAVERPEGRPRRAAWLRHHWGRFAIAASLLLGVSLAVFWQWEHPASASAAQQLVSLHQENLSSHGGMLMHESPDQSEAYLSNKLGYRVAVPRDKAGLRMKGCCVAQFLGRQAGNMVIQGAHGAVSVIVSDVNERELMTPSKIVRDGRTFWVCPMKGFYTVAVKYDGLIYCAVGDETPEGLVAILNDILNPHRRNGQ